MTEVVSSPLRGKWTLWNRLVCFFRGHVITDQPPTVTPRLNVYLCERCNVEARLQDRITGARYCSFDQWYDEMTGND